MYQYHNDLTPYAVGRRVNSEEWNAITRTFEAADDAARLGFGFPAVAGVGAHSCIAANANAQVFLGIVEAMPNLPRVGDAYARYDNVPITDMGVIAVPCEGNVVKGAQARWNTATGKWTGAAQSASVLTIPGVAFEVSATAPGVTPVRIRKPVPAVTVGS